MCKHLLGQLKIHLLGEGVRYHRNKRRRFGQMPEGKGIWRGGWYTGQQERLQNSCR